MTGVTRGDGTEGGDEEKGEGREGEENLAVVQEVLADLNISSIRSFYVL